MVADNRYYDVIGFGDEVPGVLAMVAAAREYRRRTQKPPRMLLMSKGNMQQGIGGHLVRGGLAYLDRSQISPEQRQSLGLDAFGAPAAIYQEFLQKAGVKQIALDPEKADAALGEMLQTAGVATLSNIEISSVQIENGKISSIKTAKGETYTGKQFIDATVNAELAQAAQVKKLTGFGTFGLPESELPVTLVFETKGISPQKLKDIELGLIKRFANRADTAAQQLLLKAAGQDAGRAEIFQKDMLDAKGNPKSLWIGADFIDVRAAALSVAYHSWRGQKLSLYESGFVLDEGNIAILGSDRLSWNALMFNVTGTEAEKLARNGGKPTPEMLAEISFIEKWFKSLGATAVTPGSELYIRHAGNITGVVEPLSGAKMLSGGVPEAEALGTFSYHFDVRGGIPGIGERARSKGFPSVSFHQPMFNIGIRHAIVKAVPNLAVVSPASGFEGLASAAGRIVEFNSAVGQGLGIAAVIAIQNNRNLADISNQEVRQVLRETGKLPPIFGRTAEQATLLAQLETSLAQA